MRMKRIIVFIFCMLPLVAFSKTAKEAKYDRGIVMKTFIPKGQWMVGATFSYSEHVDDNFEFLSVLKDINSEGYTFKVTPLVSYAIRDNISIGGRFAYSRSYTKLDNIDLSLGDDLSFQVEDYHDVSNTFSGAVFLRTYLNLGDSTRFGLFNEARVTYGYSTSKSTTGTDLDLSGMHQLKHSLNIGVAPGLTVFINDFSAVEASVNVAGLDFKWYDQTKDQVYKGSRRSSSANFKINLLSIDLGIVFYL